MPFVKCSAVNCAHNSEGEMCTASVIEINHDTLSDTEQTDCGAFILGNFSGAFLSLNGVSGNFEACPTVVCTVDICWYNESGKSCAAEEIAVAPHSALYSSDTFCVTYKEAQSYPG